MSQVVSGLVGQGLSILELLKKATTAPNGTAPERTAQNGAPAAGIAAARIGPSEAAPAQVSPAEVGLPQVDPAEDAQPDSAAEVGSAEDVAGGGMAGQ